MRTPSCLALLLVVGCAANHALSGQPDAAPPDAAPPDAGPSTATRSLPLALVSDFDLPGGSTRFDYQDIDKKLGHLVVTHMNDGVVLVVDLKDGSVLRQIPNIPTPRGVVVADDVGLIFVTSTGTFSRLVLIDEVSLTETSRVPTGTAPDGVGWDPIDKVVGVSDQGDGALSLIANAGSGTHTKVPLGDETGNVVFDTTRGWFWITVNGPTTPDRLVAVDPKTAQIAATIGLPGCNGAHGLRLHPDAKSAFIACEGNDLLARVDLDGAHAVTTAPSGAGPDVLSIDPGLGWLYVAAESGDLTVFDITKPGVALLGHDSPGNHSHSVAVDPATHRVFFPLMQGPNGTPVLRMMQPTGN
jgi:DNA-binding beta-propeller fold protein YncE